MNIITPAQSREARRETGLSQADVATAIVVNRAYLSEFESGNLARLTKTQLRKLRDFYESKIEEARANGDEIEITFGTEDGVANPGEKVENFTAKRVVLQVSPEVSDETLAATLKTRSNNRKQLADLLTRKAERGGSIFGAGELSEDTLHALREAFSLLATNELLSMSLCGWPEAGITAGQVPVTDDTVLGLIVGGAQEVFVQAGLIADESQQVEGA